MRSWLVWGDGSTSIAARGTIWRIEPGPIRGCDTGSGHVLHSTYVRAPEVTMANGGTRRDLLGGCVSSLPIERIENRQMRHVGEKPFGGVMNFMGFVRGGSGNQWR